MDCRAEAVRHWLILPSCAGATESMELSARKLCQCCIGSKVVLPRALASVLRTTREPAQEEFVRTSVKWVGA